MGLWRSKRLMRAEGGKKRIGKNSGESFWVDGWGREL